MKNGTRSGSGYIPVITKERYYKINIADIDLIEQTSNKLRVVTSDRNEYEFRGTIDEIAPMLVGKSFFRVMKKLVINFDNVEFRQRGIRKQLHPELPFGYNLWHRKEQFSETSKGV